MKIRTLPRLLPALLCLAWSACGDEGLETPTPSPSKKDGGLGDAPAEVSVPKEATPSPGCPGATYKLRAVAANLTSGSGQSWDAGHGARILKGLKPDVVAIQEFNVGNKTPQAIASFVAETLGPEFSYFRGTGDIPNGILSRYPIADSGNWTDPEVSNRAFTWARIDLPGSRDLVAVSVHLLTSGDRGAEVSALLGELNKLSPKSDFAMVGGDFNTKTRSDPAVSAFSSAFVTAAPYPQGPGPAGADPGNTNEPRSSPYDWVLANTELDAYEVPVAIGAKSFPNGLVFDSAYYTPLADVAPVELGDSHATGMQHMAVVRDFDIDCK